VLLAHSWSCLTAPDRHQAHVLNEGRITGDWFLRRQLLDHRCWTDLFSFDSCSPVQPVQDTDLRFPFPWLPGARNNNVRPL
jgi:hypothetical protein